MLTSKEVWKEVKRDRRRKDQWERTRQKGEGNNTFEIDIEGSEEETGREKEAMQRNRKVKWGVTWI
jgi:hypothetical protein